ncbi:flagellar hook-associated protein FlgL [Acidisoma sp.]|uniref:flagellar hook-associated protein FlgL n=1 Tax=Acidisoma sp. TaxID=1872115 RepID=UPI003B002ADE
MSASLYTNFTASIASQDSLINTLEEEISTGYAVQTPEQNPAAFEVATIASDQISGLDNDSATQNSITTQLDSVTSTYSAVSTLYNNVQSIIEQSLNGATSPKELQTLSTQISSAAQQLLGLANTTAPDGNYLFGGTRTNLTPFQTDSAGNVVYLGDAGQSQSQVSPDTTSSSVANGEVFTSALAGDGYSTVSAGASNTGDGTLLSEGVLTPATAAAFQTGNAPITISFASSGVGNLTYTASQSGNTIATGNVPPEAATGTTIELAGQDFLLNGVPAAGDSFTISPSRPQTVFALLQNLAVTLGASAGSPSSDALTTQTINGDLSTLAQYQQALLVAQAQNGVTLQAISNAGRSDANQQTALAATVQNSIAVNQPVAITTLDETISAVEAAEKAFSAAQSLSLFKYL